MIFNSDGRSACGFIILSWFVYENMVNLTGPHRKREQRAACFSFQCLYKQIKKTHCPHEQQGSRACDFFYDFPCSQPQEPFFDLTCDWPMYRYILWCGEVEHVVFDKAGS